MIVEHEVTFELLGGHGLEAQLRVYVEQSVDFPPALSAVVDLGFRELDRVAKYPAAWRAVAVQLVRPR